MKTNDLWRLLLSLVISLSAGFLGALFTTPAVTSMDSSILAVWTGLDISFYYDGCSPLPCLVDKNE
ncbi:MAG: hypothetical protein UV29_C0036G0011 [Candidatus Collierbacteria bacterium GW2011_GWD2_42_50]|nr:MAG: hypothetical protein UV29_C0036G0011 [Candidatus Collierbacteria bacterium GW2011_GWD2_42_50]